MSGGNANSRGGTRLLRNLRWSGSESLTSNSARPVIAPLLSPQGTTLTMLRKPISPGNPAGSEAAHTHRNRDPHPPDAGEPCPPVDTFARLVEAIRRNELKAMKAAQRELMAAGYSVVYTGRGGWGGRR